MNKLKIKEIKLKIKKYKILKYLKCKNKLMN